MSEAIKALVNSKKYQDARERIGKRERIGDMNQLREEADTWAPTRKAANRHLLDDEPIYVDGKIGGGMDGKPVNHKHKARGPVLTPKQWRTMCNVAAHEQAYREMGEQQAETRDARRHRAMNRPRGRTGTYEDTE